MLEQNAGKACTDQQAASYAGLTYNSGPFTVELGSAMKFGLLERPQSGQVAVTDLARRIIRPQNETQRLQSLQEAVQRAPVISDMYAHYRGENVPDDLFLRNTVVDKFGVSTEKAGDCIRIFLETLEYAGLISEVGGKRRILDVTVTAGDTTSPSKELKKLEKAVTVSSTDTCFVMMPFAMPLGGYYATVYDPAIRKAGLTPIRADNEIFGAGKIMDQVWEGIQAAKVLVAELTTRNPNVFYELGLAHALSKPVVLVSATDEDVPFDLRHIRVIYYDVKDPFWGQKLIEKVAENILSAIQNPEEAILKRTPS
jgi:hypothetical protein